MRGRTLLAAAWLSLMAVPAAAAPLAASATRAEAAAWLEQLRAAGTDVAAALTWRYEFAAAASAPLEALSLELVRDGYAIALLGQQEAGRVLHVTRVELLTPAALERRGRELEARARRHGARYVRIDTLAAAHRATTPRPRARGAGGATSRQLDRTRGRGQCGAGAATEAEPEGKPC